MAKPHQPFDGYTGRIFRWLLENGPAHAATIAEALDLDPHHTVTYMGRYQDLFIRLGKARLGSRWGCLWSVWED